jgi:pyruvate ferredoxin oxidoreductase gamma subunit
MIRVRFHGRGGQGVKTAGRILGTAAFLAGHDCQDAPVYGAERRGAAVAAFTRISDQPIRERGVISRPDLILVADETLLDDPAAAVLDGVEAASAVFVNAPADAPRPARVGSATPWITDDLTARSLAILGRASALSAGLGAAAARLVGLITEDQLVEALRQECANLHLTPEEIDRNLELGRSVYQALPVVSFQPQPDEPPDEIVRVEADDPVRAGPSILEAGNAEARLTGTWRVERPVIDYDRCTRCGLCFLRCPDGAIRLDERGDPIIDYDHCKGCLICEQICPIHGVAIEKETSAW